MNNFKLNNIIFPEYINYKLNSNILFSNIGKVVDRKDILKILNYLSRTKLFNKINIYKFKNNIFIDVKKKNIIEKFIFVGNKILDYKSLLNILKNFNISIGGLFDSKNILNFIKYINFYYKNIGKYYFHLSYKKILLKNKNFLLKFKFNEGNYLKINEIKLLGNKLNINNNLFSFDFFKKINHINSPFILNILNLNYLLKYFEYIKSIYFNYGYLDFDYVIKDIKIIKKKYINLFLKLNEGKRYKIYNVNINIKNKKFEKYFNLIKKDFFLDNYYNIENVKNIYDYILYFLKENGFYKSKINVKVIKKNFNNVNLIINVNLDKIFYFGKTILSNIYLSKQIDLNKEIPYKFGSVYKENLVYLGKDNLLKTGFFKNIIIKKKIIIKDKFYQVNVIYFLYKNYNGILNFNIGYDNKRKINYELLFSRENVFNVGNKLIFNIKKNNYFKSGYISLLYLYNYVKNIYINNKLFFNVLSDIKNNNYSYTNFDFGIKNNIIFNINDFTKYNFGINYIYNYFFNIKPHLSLLNYISSIDKIYLSNLNKKYVFNDFFIKNSFIMNSLDESIFPLFGYYINLNSKISIPFSKNLYYKFLINLSKYIYLDKNKYFLLFLNSYFGYGSGFNNKVFPFYENFHYFDNSLRGFDLNSIEPNIVYLNSKFNVCKNNNKICLSNDLLGGNVLYSLNAEFILPLYKILNEKYSNNFRASFFLDSGSLFDTTWINNNDTIKHGVPNFSKNLLRLSTGISLKINTPIGVVNISYGYPLIKYFTDKVNNFRFSISSR